MFTKLHGKPAFATSDGVAFRHFLNLHGRIHACCGWEVLLEHDMPSKILMARLTERLGHYCTVTMEASSEQSLV